MTDELDSSYPTSTSAPLFPVTPQTISDSPAPLYESLGSWLYRFCRSNGFQNIDCTFSKRSGNSSLSHGASTDALFKTQGNVELISAVTNLPLRQVERLMLSQSLLAFQGKPTNTKGQWTLRTAKTEKVGPWMPHVICPMCVLDAAEPFWLQSWRLSTTTECRIHKVMLLETCPNCKAHFVIHGKRIHPLDRCECCNLHFSEMLIETCKVANPAPDFARHAGHNQPHTLPVAQSEEHHWWRGIRQILSHIADPQRAGLIAQRSLPDEFKELLLDISLNTKHCFDEWSIRNRHSALRFVEWLTTSWPHKFVSLLACTGTMYKPAPYLARTDPPWTRDAFGQLAIRTGPIIRARYRQPQRPLLSNSTKYLSVSTCRRDQRVVPKGRNYPPNQHWSTDHTVSVIKALDARLLTMPGTVETKARFLRGAAAVILERGAMGYCVVDSVSANPNAQMERAVQTMNAWKSRVRQLDAMNDIKKSHPKQLPAMRLNNGHLSKWLNCESLHAQLTLFRWTDQQPRRKASVIQ